MVGTYWLAPKCERKVVSRTGPEAAAATTPAEGPLGVVEPVTEIAAVPVHVRLGSAEVVRVWPVIVSEVTLVFKFRFDRGVIGMIASSMPSAFSSTGSLRIVALGKATPLTTTVAGLMSRKIGRA